MRSLTDSEEHTQLDSRSSVHILQCWAAVTALVCVCVCLYVSDSHTGNTFITAAAATPDWMQAEGGVERGERGKERAYRPCQIKPWGSGQWRPFLHYKYAVLLPVQVWCLELWTSDCTSLAQEILIRSQACHYAPGGCWPQTGLQRCPFQTKEEQSEEQVWGKNILLAVCVKRNLSLPLAC